MKIEILYEDKEIMVIYKPTGLAAQSASVTQADVVSEVCNYLKTSYIGLVHRLDQPVEGLMVLAKTKIAAAHLSEQITKGKFEKIYLAVIADETKEDLTVVEDMITLTNNMIKNPATGKAEVVDYVKSPNPKVKVTKAVLHYRIKETCSHPGKEEIKLLEIRLETGRFHQIRAQMAHAGKALLGDVKYGSANATGLSAELEVKDVALCAYKLKFLHPKTKEKMQFEIKPRKPVFAYFEI